MRTTGPSPPGLVPTISSGALPSTAASEWAASTNDVLKEHVTSMPVDSELPSASWSVSSRSWTLQGTTPSSSHPTTNDYSMRGPASSSLSRSGLQSFVSASLCVSSISTGARATAVNLGHGDDLGTYGSGAETYDAHITSIPETQAQEEDHSFARRPESFVRPPIAHPRRGQKLLHRHPNPLRVAFIARFVGLGSARDHRKYRRQYRTHGAYGSVAQPDCAEPPHAHCADEITHPPSQSTSQRPSKVLPSILDTETARAHPAVTPRPRALSLRVSSLLRASAYTLDGQDRAYTVAVPLSVLRVPSSRFSSSSRAPETIDSTAVEIGHGHGTYHGPASEHYCAESPVFSEPPHAHWTDEITHTPSQSRSQSFASPSLLSSHSTAPETVESTAVDLGHDDGVCEPAAHTYPAEPLSTHPADASASVNPPSEPRPPFPESSAQSHRGQASGTLIALVVIRFMTPASVCTSPLTFTSASLPFASLAPAAPGADANGHAPPSPPTPTSASLAPASTHASADADVLSELHLDFLARPVMRSDSTGLSMRMHTGHRRSVSAVAALPSLSSPPASSRSSFRSSSPPSASPPHASGAYPHVDATRPAPFIVDGQCVQSPQPLFPEDMDVDMFPKYRCSCVARRRSAPRRTGNCALRRRV
ncbi:hypothetical protein DFH06DRAFT_1485017 [Mycena polygramma]|nr:hypothetical protein DFH06DRAFT_1485017 [Mycena polygramma]